MLTDDLAPLLVSQAAPCVRYGLGEIIAWNPDTFENTILWNGIPLTNLRLLGGTDALSYVPGNVLMLMGIDASGAAGFTQWIILGRLFTPGSDNADELVAFMRGTLAREISAEVFADRIHPAYDGGNAQRTSETFGDPTNGAAAGPSVTDIDIVTGSALIMISAGIEFSTSNNAADAAPRIAGVIGVEISGATSIAPNEEVGVSAQSIKSRSGGAITLVDGIVNATTVAAVYLQTGLNPGLHNFSLKYRKWSAGSDYVNVDQRSLTVIAF
jgi:hypothetical protein